MKKSRTNYAIKNSIFSLSSQIITLLISFISRTIFIQILGKDYLGLNGLFSNVLSVLSFMELGVGSAIIYSLYKPIANDDKQGISAFMNLYAKIYRIIGIVIFVVGVLIVPVLPYLVKEYEQYKNMNIIMVYILFLINTSMSYFYTYKRSLITANQKKYIDSINRMVFLILLNVVQIIALYMTKNYEAYLIIQIVFTLLENIVITIIANKMYPYLNKNKKEKIKEEDKKTLVKNVKALVMHKVGSTFVNGTDNIVISSFIGLQAVGIYSNYYLIINSVKVIINQIFVAITASVGNLNATETVEKSFSVYKVLTFANFWTICITSIMLLTLLNPFIELWVGNEYVFSISIVVVLVINYYLYEMRQTIFTYKNTYALFTQDKFVPIIESIINLTITITLAMSIGVLGVFIGTIIACICTSFWTEPYYLYKKFDKKLSEHFIQYFKYLFVTIILAIITFILVSLVNSFVLKVLISFIIPNVMLLIIYRKNSEFKTIANIIRTKFTLKT